MFVYVTYTEKRYERDRKYGDSCGQALMFTQDRLHLNSSKPLSTAILLQLRPREEIEEMSGLLLSVKPAMPAVSLINPNAWGGSKKETA